MTQALDKVQAAPNELAILERCKAELASMQDLESVLELRDRSQAIKSYMKARGDARDSQNSAACIAAMAEARAGQLIKLGKEDGTIQPVGPPIKPKTILPSREDYSSPEPELILPQATKLSDLGINHNESSRLQIAAEVLDNDPEWFDKHREECASNGWDFTQQSVIRRGKELRNDSLPLEIPTPKGLYDTIVIDPPWPTEQIEMETRPQPSNVGFDYPTMNEDQLKELELPAADDCHLWLWTTQRFLPMALRLAPVWGFKYVFTFVWHKTKGMQPFKLPYYNCEFALYCRKGTPKFVTTKGFKTCYEWQNTGHSRKPDEFYELVSRVCSGSRIDIFGRREIEGFESWGNESPSQKETPPESGTA